MPWGCGKIIVFIFKLSDDVKALWESESALGPQRKHQCYFSDLFSKSPLVKYQPKISPTWAFCSIPDLLNGCNCAVFIQPGPMGLGFAVKHVRAELLASKKFLLWFLCCDCIKCHCKLSQAQDNSITLKSSFEDQVTFSVSCSKLNFPKL